MNGTPAERDPVEKVAEEFLERRRRGENPSLSEYAVRYPELAEHIRELFPALVVLEEVGSPGGPVQPLASAALPERVGDYRILREVGRGGMGVVYEAVQESLGRHVALKVLPFAALAGSMHLERFQREAKAAARLHHSNIVPVFGVGTASGLHYYAMQLIHGQGLDAVLREVARLRGGENSPSLAASVAQELCSGRLTQPHPPAPPTEADTPTAPSGSQAEWVSQSEAPYFRGVARVGLQVAEALAYAHRQGVLHRDIKPSNVLLDTQGTAWVTDFGLAQLEDGEPLTASGDLVGTLRYMAPERLQGVSEPASDVYSLGVTLYELLTLRPAFGEPNRARLLEQVLREEPARPRHLDRRIPQDLETIILKATAKEPRRRYATADELAEDLRRFLSDRPIAARRTTVVERVMRWTRRNPRLAGLMTLVMLLLLVILIGSPFMMLRLETERDAARSSSWEARLAQAEALRLTGQAGRRFDGLRALDEARALLPSWQKDPARVLTLRNAALASLCLSDLGAVRWEGHPPGLTGVAFDADLERCALGDQTGTIRILQVADGGEVLSLAGPGLPAWVLTFSPDGRYLAAGYRCSRYQREPDQFQVWDCRAAGTPILALPQVRGQPAFSRDSRRLAYCDAKGTVRLVDLTPPTDSGTELIRGVKAEYVYLDFHPNGEWLALAESNNEVGVYELSSGKSLTRLEHGGQVRGMTWREDGRFLAVANGNNITLWSEETWKDPAVLRGHEGGVTDVAFSRRGDLLASRSYDGTVRLWDVARRVALVRSPHVFTCSGPLCFRKDDRRLGFAWDGDRLCLWDVASGAERRSLLASRPLGLEPRGFSPDGRLLAFTDRTGVYLWDWAATGKPTFLPQAECWALQFTSDGRLLTSGKEGVQSWPVEPQKGPPKRLWQEKPLESSSFQPDGRRVVARTSREEAVLLDLDQARAVMTIHDPPNLHYVALSPDGRWVASAQWIGTSIRVTDATTEAQRELPATSVAAVAFSPDGRLLAASTGTAYSVWDVETWRLRYELPKHPAFESGRIAFAAKGTLMAVLYAPTRVHLLDPQTGVQLAELQMPVDHTVVWLCLSADGNRVAAGCMNRMVYVWDLQLLRAQLAERGLDWTSPAR